MKKKLLAMLFGTSLVLAACGGGGDEAQPEPAENEGGGDQATEQPAENGGGETGAVDTAGAEEIFQQSCASCHGQDLTGGVGPDLTAIGAQKSQDEILAVIKNGQGSMPPGLIQGENAQKVAAWLAAKK